MNITRESLSNLEYRVKIEIAESDYAENVTKQLKNYKSRVQVPGFRKGMAPMSMIQRMYKGAVTADEVQNILNENLFKYIDDEKLNVVGSPLANDELTGTPDFEKGKDFTSKGLKTYIVQRLDTREVFRNVLKLENSSHSGSSCCKYHSFCSVSGSVYRHFVGFDPLFSSIK